MVLVSLILYGVSYVGHVAAATFLKMYNDNIVLRALSSSIVNVIGLFCTILLLDIH